MAHSGAAAGASDGFACMFEGVESTRQVGLQYALPVCVLGYRKRRQTADARIGYGNGQRRLSIGRFYGRLHLGFTADIRRVGISLTQGPQFLQRAVQLLPRAAHDADPGAVSNKGPGTGKPDAAAAPGDERVLAVKLSSHSGCPPV